MTSLRVWLLVLAAAFFLAGLGAGLFLGLRVSEQDQPRGSFADFEKLFLTEFQLEPERRELFQDLLRSYDHDLEAAQARYLVSYRSNIEGELERLFRDYNDLLRNYVLRASERSRFDQLVSAQTLVSTQTPTPNGTLK